MIDLSPELLAQRGRVSSAAPSLSPEKRAIRDYRERQRFKADAAADDAEAKDKAAGAPDGQRSRTKKEASGYALQPDELIRRLTKVTKRLHFHPCTPDTFYGKRTEVRLITGDPENPFRHIGGFTADRPVPEFTIFERLGPERVVARYMGWRTLLVRLMAEKVITKTKADIIFGPPKMDSKNWKSLTT